MAGEDVTLRIGGEAEGAKRAAKETADAVRQVGQAAGQASGPIAETGHAGEEAGKGFDFGRREAARLAQTLVYTTGIGGQFAGSLTYLLQAALNPATLGFAAAVIAVQGLTAAFRAGAAETEAEKRRMEELVRTYGEATKALESLIRTRGEWTGEATGAARREQLNLASVAGVSPEEAAEAMKAGPAAGLTATEAALAWAGRPAEREGMTIADVARRFRRRRRAEERNEWIARGEERAAGFPAARGEAAGAAGLAEREEGRTAEDEVAERFARYAGIPAEEARGVIRGEAKIRRAQKFAAREGVGIEPEAYMGEGWKVRTGVRFVGMEVHQHFGGADRPGIFSDGQPRGPGH